MGNAVLCAFPPQAASAPSMGDDVVKLVHSNGLVEEFYRPVMVGELSSDYPQHFFCHSQSLLSLSMHPHSTPPPPPPSSLALADDFHMQLGQIYFLLPLHFSLSHPSIAALLSKASVASTKESYRDIHVVPFSDYPMFDSPEPLYAAPITHDFVKQLLAEARLQLPTSITGRFLISPLKDQQQCSRALSSTSADTDRISSRDPWRPPLETIFEEGDFCIS